MDNYDIAQLIASLFITLFNFIDCEDTLYGCKTCFLTTTAYGGDFLQCTSCLEGLYLFQNKTRFYDNYPESDKSALWSPPVQAIWLPTSYTFCVTDCTLAH